MTAVVASGKQDATTAKDVVIAHNKSGAIAHTIARQIITCQQREGKLGKNPLAGIPVRSIAEAQMEYDDNDTFLGIRFFKHAGFGTGKLLPADKLDKMWVVKQGHTGVVIVDWPIDKQTGEASDPIIINTATEDGLDSEGELAFAFAFL